MTDTTDIKKQISNANYRGDHYICAKVADIEAIIDQIEAERQRADDLVLHVNTQANMREKAEAEIAEMKDEQVPVVWKVTTPSGSIVFHTEEQDMDGHSYYGNTVTPLFTSPQKPVVLPPVEKWRHPGEVRAQNAYRILVEKEIKAAGGIVTEGE